MQEQCDILGGVAVQYANDALAGQAPKAADHLNPKKVC